MPNSDFFRLDVSISDPDLELLLKSLATPARHWFVKLNRLLSLVWVLITRLVRSRP